MAWTPSETRRPSSRPAYAPSGRGSRRGVWLTAAACAIALSACPDAQAGEPTVTASPASVADPVNAALTALASPFEAEREQAVADLVALGPSARAGVQAAFATADGARRPLLVRVLAADGSPESLHLLLKALPFVQDAATATAIERSLVDHAEAVTEAVESWRDGEGRVPPRIAELLELLQRARIESRFLARKSPSGGTGSYPGQFESLRPDRKRAMEVCLSILLDTAYKEPGQFPSGAYRYLRPPPFLADRQELRHMALNAVAELAMPEDTVVVRQLEALYGNLDAFVNERGRWQAHVEAALLDATLATLARLKPEVWRQEANLRVRQLASDETTLDEAAGMSLRLGNYEDAVKHYSQILRRYGDKALSRYNMACAYARWSLDPGPSISAKVLRDRALVSMAEAVRAGYADWAWMEQDRDLDPIRTHEDFQKLIEKIKAAFAPPSVGTPRTPGTSGFIDSPRAPDVPPSVPPPPAMDGTPPPVPEPVPGMEGGR